MKRRTVLGLLTLSATMAAAAAACQAEPDGAGGSELVVGATAEPSSLDPLTNDAAAIPQALLYNLYQTLVRVDDAGEIQPLLATDWQVSEDGLRYTFHLDERATFAHENRPLTAADVKWSFELTRDEGRAVLANSMAVIAEIEAADDHTVVVTLSQPSNSWLYAITSTAGIIYDQQADIDRASGAAGSGPYLLTSWSKGSDLVLSRRDDYWAEQPYFTRVTLRYFENPNTENAAMLAGELDILSSLQAPQALEQFTDPARFTVIEGTTNGEVVMSFNNEGVLADKRLRQAIRYAVDHQALLDTVWAGHGTLIGSMVPPTDPWYEDLTGMYPYDPDRARELIAESGYDPGTELRMRLPVLPYATAAGQFVASQLTDVGLSVVTDELEFPARWLDLVLTKADYDISIVAHVEPRDLFTFADPDYYWRYDNPQVQQLIAEADAGSWEDYVAKLKQAARIISEDAACDFLFLLPNLVVTTLEITGVQQNATSLSFDLTGLARTS